MEKQFRIGNIIDKIHIDYGKSLIEIDVEDLELMRLGSENISYHPIPLTEEWFIKFKADKDREYYYLNPNPSITFFFNSLKNTFWIDVNGLDIKTDIKFVHELQNWYYCNSEKEELLTNKEN